MKTPFSRVVQSFAEVLAGELARLESAELPPSSAFAPPARSFDIGLLASMGTAFYTVESVVPAPPVPVLAAPVVRELAVDRLLRRFLRREPLRQDSGGAPSAVAAPASARAAQAGIGRPLFVAAFTTNARSKWA